MNADNVESLLEEFFEANFAEIQADRGQALAPYVRDTAFLQVQLYWRRLRDIAERVTETEVRLLLGGQRTPEGRPFTIEGIVDVVREEQKVTLYDIKTHDAAYVRDNVDQYVGQLNLYAHIWATLYQDVLQETAIICTAVPEVVREAMLSGKPELEERALGAWQPVVPLPFSLDNVKQTVEEFGSVVDAIERHHFPPRSLAALQSREVGQKSRFATVICRNCDARFSCPSYREYATGSHGTVESALAVYLRDYGDDPDREDFTSAALEAPVNLSDDDL